MLADFTRHTLAGLRMLLALTVVTGVLYPATVLLAGQALLPGVANGSLVRQDGAVVGSALIGQRFAGDEWFWPRPSAAGSGYDATASGASNLGPDSRVLLAQVEQRRATVSRADGVPPGHVPADALTASGSGLDPDISPAYARLQVDRVAAARGLDRPVVAALVERHVEGRQLGFLGEPRVNVLELNLALARLGH